MSHYCFNCFHHMESGTTRCSKCGFDCAAYQKPAAAIQPETVLMDRYVIGKVVEQKSSTIAYVAKDRQKNKKVVIREYFPSAVAVRQTDGTLAIRSHSDKQNFVDGMNAFIKETKSRKKMNDQPGHRSVIDSFNANNTVYRVLTYKKKKAADIPTPAQKQTPKYVDPPFFDPKPATCPDWELDQEKTVNKRYTQPQDVKNIAANGRTSASSNPPKKAIFIILAIVLAAAIAAGVYFFVLKKSPMTIEEFKEKAEEEGYTANDYDDGCVYVQERQWIVQLYICKDDDSANEFYDAVKEDIDSSLQESKITDQSEETSSGINYKAVEITYSEGQEFKYIGRIDDTVIYGYAIESDSTMRDFIDACGYPLP